MNSDIKEESKGVLQSPNKCCLRLNCLWASQPLLSSLTRHSGFHPGRCVNTTLTCNSQNDCGDNSDERDCRRFTVVCPREMRPTPGVNLVGNG